jgi:hypothetical protein
MRGAPHYPDRILHFFCTHYRLQVAPAFVVDITGHIDRKLEAVACYRSQFNEERNNLGILETIRTIAAYWGSRIRRPFGEPFASKEPVGVRSLSDVL